MNSVGMTSRFAGGGKNLDDSGPASAALLNWPTAVAVSSWGDVFIAEQLGSRIRKVSKSSAQMHTHAHLTSR